ncbi:ABC transporter ATP-binding protein [Curtobacterium oceanosedimentum]|uniref:ABC transporter ATP-binding protein n=1 Tax=Curtobacterium oceanosedimentum TaxID=465820 RepID=A0A147DN80_9MICO|nr:ABC transporter ATP-binding protein [Curtobacterium oceanosedimentum]KTR50843.1 ABC transporter ATP-binding protein [Curtobacterium oceanosedimentum]
MTAALTVDAVTRTFRGDAGVRDVSFVAQERSVTAVIGPNGAGKTVLFGLLAGLADPETGSVVRASPDTTVAYCPDVPQFESFLTAAEVVRVSLAAARGRRRGSGRSSPTGDVALEALDTCGLLTVAHRRVADFSRGMLQRLGLAAALVTNPDVLVLDEPNSALDPVGRADVRDLVRAERERRCIVLSSHLLSEVEQLADHVVVLHEGRVVLQGTTDDVLGHALEPVWSVRLAHPPERSVAELAALVPGARFDFPSAQAASLRFQGFDSAATLLVPALVALDTPVLEVTLRDRDLDASFARIIRQEQRP